MPSEADGKPDLSEGGFYAILDTGYVSDEDWTNKAGALLRGGACLLQIRAKGEALERISERVAAILPLAREHAVPVIVNDHLEVALAFPGVGLHIGQDDGDPAEVRQKLGPDRILGWSTHSLAQAEAALRQSAALSYFAVGPIFATGTKPDYTPVGLDLVTRVRALNPDLPFFAIGGISRQNLSQVLNAGARGLVAVSDPLCDPDTEAATRAYTDAILQART
jgi:thiamine-phosphate pyrophosphorylase